jgi:hypothetical protein
VEVPPEYDIQCLDLDETVKVTVGDREVHQYLQKRYGISDSIKVQTLDKDKRTDDKPSAMMLALIAEVRRRSSKGQTR